MVFQTLILELISKTLILDLIIVDLFCNRSDFETTLTELLIIDLYCNRSVFETTLTELSILLTKLIFKLFADMTGLTIILSTG